MVSEELGHLVIELAEVILDQWQFFEGQLHQSAIHGIERRARPAAAQGAAIARDHSFGLMLAWASTYEGRALADLGEADQGLSMMREGVVAGRVTGSSLFESFQLALFAEAQLRKGLYDV
jgi:hypothetical protein